MLSDKVNMLELFYACDDIITRMGRDDDQKICENHYRIWEILFERNRSKLTEYRRIKLKNSQNPKVFLSFTTCKRLDLFKQTINSILNHWTDLDKIDYWYCVDDNSSSRDRIEMKKSYRWIDFRLKTEDEKGHRSSMNIIWEKLKATGAEYWIHLEDDFLFYKKRPYVSDGIQALEDMRSRDVKQVLFNRNYAETVRDHDLKGHIVGDNIEVVEHDHKEGTFPYRNCHYWPHYSFRPSIIDAKAVIALGNYETSNKFFEMDYAQRWTANGYKSAFFNMLTSRHIGRLTSERNDKNVSNAYELNQVEQF